MTISWPERYAPDRVAARVSNQIRIAASPAAVWAWLILASRWPQWYPNCGALHIDGGGSTLSPGARFKWRTFGVTVASTVREFVPEERIAWDGRALLLDIYHVWLIEPRSGGSWVLTEENQNGVTAVLQRILMPRRMYRGHQLWLSRLKERAEAGLPP